MRSTRTLTGHTVGVTYWSRYWREHYTVVSANKDQTITVEWWGDARIGNATQIGHDKRRRTTHSTPIGDDFPHDGHAGL